MDMVPDPEIGVSPDDQLKSELVRLFHDQQRIFREISKRRKEIRNRLPEGDKERLSRPGAGQSKMSRIGLSVSQVSYLLRVHHSTVWDLLRRGELQDTHPLTVGEYLHQGYGLSKATKRMLLDRDDWRDWHEESVRSGEVTVEDEEVPEESVVVE